MLIKSTYLTNGRRTQSGAYITIANVETDLLQMRKRIATANKMGVFKLGGTDRELSQKAMIICDLHADAEAALDVLVKRMFMLTGRSFGMKVQTETLCGQHEYSIAFRPTRLMLAYSPALSTWTADAAPIENAAKFANMCATITGNHKKTVDQIVVQSVFSVTAMKQISDSRIKAKPTSYIPSRPTMFIGDRHVAMRHAMVRHSAHIAPRSYTKDGLIAMALSSSDEIQMLGERVLDEWVVGTALDVYITNLVAQAGIMCDVLNSYMYAAIENIWKRLEEAGKLRPRNANAYEFETTAFGKGVYVYRGFPAVRSVKLEQLSDGNIAAVNVANKAAKNAVVMTPLRYQFRVTPDALPVRMPDFVDSVEAEKGRDAFVLAKMDCRLRVSSKIPLVLPKPQMPTEAPKTVASFFAPLAPSERRGTKA